VYGINGWVYSGSFESPGQGLEQCTISGNLQG
jgi:hypothetical protein